MSERSFPIERLPAERLQALQLSRLQGMVDYCIKNVPFYTELLRGAGIRRGQDIARLSDIQRIPFTTKEDLQAHYPFGFLAVPMDRVARIHTSSGSAGQPTVGYYTAADLATWRSAAARVLRLNGVTRDDVFQISVGYGMFTGALGFHQGAEEIGCTVIPASTGNTDRQLAMLCDFGVTAITATPSYAVYLSEQIRERGLTGRLKLRRVLLGAERCSPAMRRTIEANLGVETADNYGMTEFFGPGFSGECACRCGMHVTEDLFYPEIVQPETGAPLPDGEMGELVVTSLQREAMPLLRYRTRDLTSLNHAPCACGRTTVRVQAPYGRTDDMFVLRGVNIFPSQVEYAISQIPQLAPHYLITLSRSESFRDAALLEVECQPGVTADGEALRQALAHRLREILLVRMEVRLCAPGTLPRYQGKGKRVRDLREHAAEEGAL